MTAERAKAGLEGARFARIEWVQRTGSTNSDLLARARAGAPEQVLVADEQTAGRGRLGRTWQAPPGSSLLCSILVREVVAPAEAWRIAGALGLAAAGAVEATCGVRLGVKWPNDLVAPGAGAGGADLKVAGMLAESVVEGDRVTAVVAGIGINVAWPEPLPDELAATATSLARLAPEPPDRVDLLVALLRGYEAQLDRPVADLLAEQRRRSATLGRTVRVEQAGGAWQGRAVELAPDGALVVDVAGERRHVHAGDVVHLRPVL
jgi:BirA family biotin operon repressor/biotin-[acetyl-CoA-carboxylase] ligase